MLLGYSEDEPINLVLESDGTLVDEDYAKTLERHSVLVALTHNENWTDHKQKKGSNNYVNTTCLDSVKCVFIP